MTRNSAILCVAACLGAAAVPAYRLFEKHRSPVRRTIFVTVAGKTLPNLFSGLESDPQRFDWRHRARGAGSEGPAECAAKPTLVTRLLTSMHLSTVHASSCPPSVCNGNPRRSRHIPVLRQRCGLHSQHLAVHVDQRYIQPRRLRHWTGRLSFLR